MFFVVAMSRVGTELYPMAVGKMHETADAAWRAFPEAEEKRSRSAYATPRSDIDHYCIVQIVDEIHQTAPPQFARSPYLSIAAPAGGTDETETV